MFGEDEAVQQQVRDADMPVEEALSLVRLSKFFTEYGKEPEEIVSNIEKRAIDRETPKIREEESKRILADLKKTSKLPKGLSGVKGASSSKEDNTSDDIKEKSLEETFDSQ